MDLNLQIFTGGCNVPAEIDKRSLIDKINKILKKTKITSVFAGWNKDTDLSDVFEVLKQNGTEIYLWLPIFSELNALADFPPLIRHDQEKLEINFDMGTGEEFIFYCPSTAVERVIEVFEKHYYDEIYDGVFIDKIRFPSFIGGSNSALVCYCRHCNEKYHLPDPKGFTDSINPLGITGYESLRYSMDHSFEELFKSKGNVIYHSLEELCKYFRERGMKIGLDLFVPFLAYFVGQDYHRLLGLADIVKPMFYSITNAPAGIPFEIDMYAGAFDDDSLNAQKRKEILLALVGYDDGFIRREVTGINKIIKSNDLQIKHYAGIELNYVEHIAPVTEAYIRESIANTSEADGIVPSWDLNTIPDSHIDCLMSFY